MKILDSILKIVISFFVTGEDCRHGWLSSDLYSSRRVSGSLLANHLVIYQIRRQRKPTDCGTDGDGLRPARYAIIN
jgi:hypothetical protein